MTHKQMKLKLVAATVLLAILQLHAANDYLITWISPPTKIDTATNIRIDYTKLNPVAKDSVTIYFGAQTGGGIPANYPYKASFVFKIDTATLRSGIDTDSAVKLKADSLYNRKGATYTDGAYYTPAAHSGDIPANRSIFIRPFHQDGINGVKTMSAGRFYFIVKGKDGGVSQEAQLIVETREAATITSPKGTITSMQPIFKWNPVAGVPYYHLLLSDQPINITENGLSNASFIWQAIVPGSEIQYGAPDPSGLFPLPPPLAPGVGYQWLVLNNYGNQKEYTSFNALPIPSNFTIQGSLSGLTAPDSSKMITKGDGRVLNSFYDSLGSLYHADSFMVGEGDSANLTFSWNSISHPDKNLYRVYLYNIVFDPSTNSDAAVVVWTKSTTDTSVTINAKSFLASSVMHVWKVFVENTSGAGVVSDKKAFFYADTSPKAIIRYRSYERVGDTDSIVIKFANVTITPLSGGGLPIDLPTDINGYGSKTVQYGNYRVLINPSGYRSDTRDVVVSELTPDTTLTFVLTPYPAQFFGTVVDSGTPVGDATVEAISSTGDTVKCNTDASGSFSLPVDAGDWLVTASKLGYRRSSPPLSFSPTHGQSVSTGAINISRFTTVISGTVRNSMNNAPIINATVTLRRGGNLIGERRTTDAGYYSFSVEPASGYSITVSKQGFSSANRNNITLTTNIVYNAVLSSSTGSLSGTVFVTSNSVSSGSSSFVTNGRQAVLITAVDSLNDTVATTESSRGDNTYLFTLVPGNYKLYLSGNSIVPDSVASIEIVANTTANRNIYLKEYGRIIGKVFALSGSVNNAVTVTASNSSGAVRTAISSASTGGYTINNLTAGNWRVKFSKVGFATDSAQFTIVDTTLSGGAKALTSRYAGTDSLEAGNLSLSFSMAILDSSIVSDSSQIVRLIYPTAQNIKYGTSLSNLGTGLYRFGTRVSFGTANILNVDSLGKNLQTDGDTIRFKHPFRYLNRAVADTTPPGDSIDVSIVVRGDGYSGASVIPFSPAIYFRDQSANSWNSSSNATISDSTITFRILPSNDNSNMVFYFDVKASQGTDTIKWSNRLTPYSLFVPPTSGIKFVTVFPASWSSATPATLPWRTTTSFTVLCQDGSFAPRTPSQIRWTAVNRSGVITFSGLSSATLTATVTGDSALINESTVDSVLCIVTLDGSRDTTVKTYFRIIKKSVDLLVVTSSSPSIAANQQASFIVAGLNSESGELFQTQGSWSTTTPFNAPYGINSTGTFRSPPNYIGTVGIRVEAFGKRAIYQLPVIHQIKAGDSTFAYNASNIAGAGLLLGFGSSVYPQGVGRDIGLSSTSPEDLPVLKAVSSLGEVISPVYKLELGNSSSAKPYAPFAVTIKIPENYRGKSIFPAVWNQRKTKWDTIPDYLIKSLDATRYPLSKANHFTADSRAAYIMFSTRHLGILDDGNGTEGEYALLNVSDKFGVAELKVGPNPFSPLVISRDSAGNRWQGLRIEFFVNSDESPQSYSEVQILNMEGNVINNRLMTKEETVSEGFKNLYSLDTKGGFYGRRTIKRVYIWDGYTSGGRACRNGRYLVRIRATDGIKTEYRTIPVTLFK